MTLFHLEDIRPHYVRTLAEWRRRCFANLEQVNAQGFSTKPAVRRAVEHLASAAQRGLRAQ